MYLKPNSGRLRLIAILCWVLSGWFIAQLGSVPDLQHIYLFSVAKVLASVIFLALGIAFWQLGTDRRAGILLDSKGIMLNLGNQAAFVEWSNIESIGVSRYRNSLMALGSSQQLGLRLHKPQAYIQSYEERLPASAGPIGWALRLLVESFRLTRRGEGAISLDNLADMRARTGYDVLVPEALLGRSAETFLEVVGTYRHDLRQHALQQHYVQTTVPLTN